jgi:ADP-ribose pyrophosphatase YjhB (NUDIX family)
MGYVDELREIVGNRALILVGATVLILDGDDRLLMVRRTDNGCWGVPGGVMELGESIEDTAKRETKEEIGIDIQDIKLFGVYSGQELHYQYPDGAEVYNVSVVYLTHNIAGKMELNRDEHSEYRFFDIRALPTKISPPIKPILSDLYEMKS